MNKLEEVLEKYFRDERTIYYIVADAIRNSQYISWAYLKHERNNILITLGSNDGEARVKTFTDPDKLESFLKLILF